MRKEEIIKKCEETMLQLKQAEEVLTVCDGICESYFKYGYHSEGNNIRYNTIRKAIEEYFKKKGEEYDIKSNRSKPNTDRGIQSESR